MQQLQDKVVMITGASSGIGHALAKACLEKGARLALCARQADRLQEAFKGEDPSRVFCMAADISIWEDCERFVQGAHAHYGRLDLLINNAGISMRALFDEVDIKVLKELMDINFWGTVYCTKLALPYLKAAAPSSIIGVSSIAGYRGLPARSGYSASKFAMQGFLESLRVELKPHNIEVMWVSPGFTASEIRKRALGPRGRSQEESPLAESQLMSAEEVARRILEAWAKKKRSLVMTQQGKWTVWLNKWLPSLTDKLVYRHFLREPDSPLQRPANDRPGEPV